MKGEIKILVDFHEEASGIPDILRKLGAKTFIVSLPIGDYQPSERVVIERKSTKDFISSIKKKRLFEQLRYLSELVEIPILLIEGEDLYSEKGIHRKGILGALTSIVVYYSVPTIFTRNREESAEFIFLVARREVVEKPPSLAIFEKKRAKTRKEEIMRVVLSLPGIGPYLASNLVSHFKTLRNLFNASETELLQVEGIGKERAKKLRELFLTAPNEIDSLFSKK